MKYIKELGVESNLPTDTTEVSGELAPKPTTIDTGDNPMGPGVNGDPEKLDNPEVGDGKDPNVPNQDKTSDLKFTGDDGDVAESVIVIPEDFVIPGTNVIIEAGDMITVIKEELGGNEIPLEGSDDESKDPNVPNQDKPKDIGFTKDAGEVSENNKEVIEMKKIRVEKEFKIGKIVFEKGDVIKILEAGKPVGMYIKTMKPNTTNATAELIIRDAGAALRGQMDKGNIDVKTATKFVKDLIKQISLEKTLLSGYFNFDKYKK